MRHEIGSKRVMMLLLGNVGGRCCCLGLRGVRIWIKAIFVGRSNG